MLQQVAHYAAPFLNSLADKNKCFNSAQNYLHNDPEGYRKWLPALTLPEEELKRLPK